MDTLRWQDLERLETPDTTPCVSIFIPTHRARPETEQDPIRLRNLLSQADSQLRALGLRSPEAAALLSPASDLLQQHSFWLHQAEGLAVFVRPGWFHTFRLPLPFNELVVVGDRFHVRPLLPHLAADGRFFVLALSQNQVRLLEGSRHSIEEMELGDAPESLAEALHYEDRESQLLLHIAGRGSDGPAIFHGHGSGREVDRERLVRFFRAVDKGLSTILREERAPMVLAGVESGTAVFREVSSYPELTEGVIPGNPEEMSDAELHRRAWEMVGPRFEADLRADLERFAELDGTGRVAKDPIEVLLASRAGRVGVLFASATQELWGTSTGDGAAIHEERKSGDEDLVDAAVAACLRTGTRVHVLNGASLPVSPMAAVLRY